MVRKFLLPVLMTGLLGGCVTAGYDYRYGPGDYYYGQPSTEYRYYGAPSYGYYPYGYSRYGYPYGYGGYSFYNHYYGYGYPYYGYPYYPYRPHRPRPPAVGHHDPSPPPPGHKRDDYRVPPWRDLRHRPAVAENAGVQPRLATPSPRPAAPPAPPRIEPRRDSGSRATQVIQRSQEPRRRDSAATHDP